MDIDIFGPPNNTGDIKKSPGSDDEEGKRQTPMLPRKRGHESDRQQSKFEDDITGRPPPSAEGTGNQLRVVPQPTHARPSEHLQPQQTQEACCLMDDDDNTQGDRPMGLDECIIKAVDGKVVQARSYESAAVGGDHSAGQAAALDGADQFAAPSRKDGNFLKNPKKRKLQSPQNSQGGSGATVTSGDGHTKAEEKRRKSEGCGNVAVANIATHQPSRGGEETSGDGTRRGSGGSGEGSNDDVDVQKKDALPPRGSARSHSGHTDGGGRCGNRSVRIQEEEEKEEGKDCDNGDRQGGSRGSESGQVDTGHAQHAGTHSGLQLHTNCKQSTEREVYSAPPPNNGHGRTELNAAAAAAAVPDQYLKISNTGPWLPTVPFQKLGASSGGTASTAPPNVHRSRQSLLTMESFYAQAQHRFLHQAHDIMNAALIATKTGLPGPAPDLQAITRACATAVSIINSFASGSSMHTPGIAMPPGAKDYPSPAAAAAAAAAAAPASVLAPLQGWSVPGSMPMVYGGVASMPMSAGGVVLPMGAPPVQMQQMTTLGGPGAVDALRMHAVPTVSGQYPLAQMVPVDMMGQPPPPPQGQLGHPNNAYNTINSMMGRPSGGGGFP